jgi:hypothetical protein
VLCLKPDLQIAQIPIKIKTEEKRIAESTANPSKSIRERELQEICQNQCRRSRVAKCNRSCEHIRVKSVYMGGEIIISILVKVGFSFATLGTLG